MIYGFLIAYTLFTAPLIGWALWRALRKRSTPAPVRVEEPKAEPAQPASQLAKIIEEAFGKQGITAKVHEVPSTPSEAIAVYAQAIMMCIRDSDAMAGAWFKSLASKADINKRDVDALMGGMQALIKSVKELQDARELPAVGTEGVPGKNMQQFASYFAYARDNFKLNATQKKVVDSIIKNLTT